MYTTYHLSSPEEITTDILDAIKANFKSKAIVITVEEEKDYELSQEMKDILDERLAEDKSDYISAEQSINELKQKYGL
jgi:spore coat polysaccharide biosynthesis protein SpsF (cytidylyltransferase family)